MDYLTNIKEKFLIIRKNEEKTNAKRSTALALVEDHVGYKIE